VALLPGCRLALGLTALLLAAPGTLTAQQADDLIPGARVRVTVPRDSRDPYVGTLDRLSSDSLTLRIESRAPVLTLPLTRVRRIEVSAGETSKVVTGGAIGFGVGATASLLFLAGFCSDPDTLCGGDEWLRAFAFIALPSTLVGAGIGLLIRTERWREVELAPPAALHSLRAPRWHIGLSLPF